MNNILSFNNDEGVMTVNFNTNELQLFKMPELIDNFWEYVNEKAFSKLVFDLQDLFYIDSSALGFFVRVHIKLSKMKIEVVLKNVHNDIMKILENAKLVKDFIIE